MKQRRLIQAWAAPLHWPTAYQKLSQDLTLDTVLQYSVGFQEGRDPQELFARYREIMKRVGGIVFLAVPMNELYVTRIISPVKQALVHYIFGNYISAILTAGYVGEVMAILHFQMNEHFKRHIKLGGKEISLHKFEKSSQRDRSEILFWSALIKGEECERFVQIHEVRIKYNHNLTHNWADLKQDAAFMVGAVIELVSTFNGNKIDKDGNLILNEEVLMFLAGKASDTPEK